MTDKHSLRNTPAIKINILLKLFSKIDFPHKKGMLDKLFGKSISKQGIGWAKTWTGHEWQIDGRNPCHRWMIYDRYADSGFLKWAEKNVPANGVIIDSGSNIGQFLPYFSNIAPNGKILAFEPNNELAEWIDACITKNTTLPVELIIAGLGEIVQNAYLQKSGGGYIHGLWSKVSESDGEPIHITTITHEIEIRNIPIIDLWKLDVEGYEINALEGAKRFLLNKTIKALYIEMAVKENNHLKIFEYMKNIGYIPFEVLNNGKLVELKAPKDFQIDALFLPA